MQEGLHGPRAHQDSRGRCREGDQPPPPRAAKVPRGDETGYRGDYCNSLQRGVPPGSPVDRSRGTDHEVQGKAPCHHRRQFLFPQREAEPRGGHDQDQGRGRGARQPVGEKGSYPEIIRGGLWPSHLGYQCGRGVPLGHLRPGFTEVPRRPDRERRCLPRGLLLRHHARHGHLRYRGVRGKGSTQASRRGRRFHRRHRQHSRRHRHRHRGVLRGAVESEVGEGGTGGGVAEF
mmetsp:Transcript_25131/g.63068  ORF Transcript_25131/g.63068 Transcript_25131/m.63068 type:complete len:232 (+) Transcript_25131:469-1164(+)